MPFLAKNLTELMKSVLRRFVKREVLPDITKLQLTKLDLCEKKNLLLPQKTDISLGAEKVLKGMSVYNSFCLCTGLAREADMLAEKAEQIGVKDGPAPFKVQRPQAGKQGKIG